MLSGFAVAMCTVFDPTLICRPPPPALPSAGAFRVWCQEQMRELTGSADVTLCEFLLTVESNSELAEYCTLYLGSSPAVSQGGRGRWQLCTGRAVLEFVGAVGMCRALHALAGQPGSRQGHRTTAIVRGTRRHAHPTEPTQTHTTRRWPALPLSS